MKTAKILLVILICSFSICAQDKFSAKVKIYVQNTSDPQVVELMNSYLARELRSLKDVDVIKEDSGYTIDVIMVSIPNTRPVGYAVSVVSVKQSNCDGYAKATELLTNSVAIVWADQMKDFAERTIAKFDTQVLDSEREIFKIRHPK